jgi:predicted ATPase
MLTKRLHLKKILSFNDTKIELGQLNVLIGPNAVGKTNLIEVISLLQAAPTSISRAIERGGGVRQWLWLGDSTPPVATIECDLELSRGGYDGPLKYRLEFSQEAYRFVIVREQLCDGGSLGGTSGSFFLRTSDSVEFGPPPVELSDKPSLTKASVPAYGSVLSLFKSPLDPTPITRVGIHFEQIRIFREFQTGPLSSARHGISTGLEDALANGSDNLALVLLHADFRDMHDRIREYLRRFCERFENVNVDVSEGFARTYLSEAGLVEKLSAMRMSDGTLKFLSLLAALFHPKPPPLMCIEEPEIGLHPDAVQLVAEALLEASESMQLIVTTHSDALIDALTDRPDTVLVCERDFDNGTQMKRLSKEDLKEWLERYTLGELWRKGEIGGGRW